MRLTLRTLLAYLDDVLDPVDKEELAKKIESSEFAEDLVHRTRDTVRRLRLSAPQVIGTGMGLDPNTVAEYLDNVMPPEQVGDFERICLESDVHLAEATACHHVLTMILGSPADVDPLARQRMYTIVHDTGTGKQYRAEPAHVPQAATAAAAPAVPANRTPMPAPVAPAPAQRQAMEVPDYLRAGPWWRSTIAVAGLSAVVLAGIGLLIYTAAPSWLGIKPQNQQLAANTPSTSAPAPADIAAPQLPTSDTAAASLPPAVENSAASANPSLASPAQPMLPSMPAANGNASAAVVPAAPTNTNPPAEGDRYATTGAPPVAPPLAAAPPANENGSAAAPSVPGVDATMPAAAAAGTIPPAVDTAATGAAGASLPTTPPTEAGASLPAIPPVEASAGSALPPPTDNAAATPPVNAIAAAGTNVSGGTAPPETAAAPENNAAATPPAAGAPAANGATAPATPPDSGKYMGGKTVMLRFDEKAGTWFRVEPRAAVVPGERVLSLPEFRPRILLASGIQLDLSGGTQVVMGGGGGAKGVGTGAVPSAEAGSPAAAAAAEGASKDVTPSLEVVYGRIVLVNGTGAERTIRLRLGPTMGTAKLGPNAILGVEVERKHVPGQDPRQAAAPVETRLFAPDGNVVWVDPAGEKIIDKPSRWTLTKAGAAEIAADSAPPEWIDHEPIVQLSEQRYGAPVIESTLVATAPAETQLLELFQGSSRKEVKSLVARSSIHVGLFQPFVDALRDSEQKANWKTHIDTLRMAMALSPESATKVYQALVDQRGKPAAADLYEMLCGYAPEQIGQTLEAQKNGAILRLINWLEDDSLDYRVLAVQDLWEITGKRLMPNPAASLAERTQNVRRWRSRLEAGELKPVAAAKE